MNPDEALAKLDGALALAKTTGEMAYIGFADEVSWLNSQGEPMPTWVALPEKIRAAWECASESVVIELSRRVQLGVTERANGRTAPST